MDKEPGACCDSSSFLPCPSQSSHYCLSWIIVVFFMLQVGEGKQAKKKKMVYDSA